MILLYITKNANHINYFEFVFGFIYKGHSFLYNLHKKSLIYKQEIIYDVSCTSMR